MLGQHRGIELLEKRDRFKVFPPAVDIGHPLPVLAAIVEVEHGSDRIDAQTIHMVFLDPEHGVRDEETFDLVAPKIKDAGSPMCVLTLVHILIFIQGLSIELVQPMGVLREVRRDPVHDNTDPCLVQGIHQIHEIMRRPITGGRRIITGHLISPGTIKRIFHQRQELHIVVAHLFEIAHQFIRNLTVTVGVSILMPAPGTHVQFIDVDRAAIRVIVFAFVIPVLILPLISLDVIELGGIIRSGFGMECIRVGLHQCAPVPGFDAVFINVILGKVGDHQLPDAALFQQFHWICIGIPTVEISNDRHLCGVRRPYAKNITLYFPFFTGMRTKKFIGFIVGTLMKKIQW